MEPTWPRLRTIRRSWLVSKRGGFLPAGIGNTSSTPMPSSRNGRATPGTTTWKTPVVLEVADDSVMLPSELATTRLLAAATRMPSSRSAVPGRAVGPKSALVSSTGAGRATPVASTWIDVTETISVIASWLRLVAGVNSVTVPVTRTRLPTAALAGGAVEVNTKMPSDVAGLPSAWPSAVCRKKPLLNFWAVTTPSVVTTAPSRGENRPLPWMSWICTTVTSSFSMVPRPWASPMAAPPGLLRLTKKVSSGSDVVSPLTVISTVVAVAPSAMVAAPLAAT